MKFCNSASFTRLGVIFITSGAFFGAVSLGVGAWFLPYVPRYTAPLDWAFFGLRGVVSATIHHRVLVRVDAMSFASRTAMELVAFGS